MKDSQIRHHDTAIVFYDGGCGFCHNAVRYITLHDSKGVFRFAPLGGETYQAAFLGRVPAAFDSMLLLTPDGRVLSPADSTLYIARRLDGLPGLAAPLYGIVPGPLRALAYRAVARIRHRLARTPKASCPVVPTPLRNRFLP